MINFHYSQMSVNLPFEKLASGLWLLGTATAQEKTRDNPDTEFSNKFKVDNFKSF